MLCKIAVNTLRANLHKSPSSYYRSALTSNHGRKYSAYEGISHTHAEILNKKDPKAKHKMIEKYSTVGFRLTDQTFVIGPMLIFEKHIFCWNVKDDSDITPSSIEFLMHLHPPIDILVIGYSENEDTTKYRNNVHLYANRHNVAVEMLPVNKAVGMYNFLVKTRSVAGAFIPPQFHSPNMDDCVFDNLENYYADDDPWYEDEVEEGTLPYVPKWVKRKRITDGKTDEKVKTVEPSKSILIADSRKLPGGKKDS